MAFFATLGLVFVLLIRPQEIYQGLNAFRLLDVFTVLATLGVIIQFAQGKLKNAYSPQLPFLAAFFCSIAITSLKVEGPAGMIPKVTIAIFLVIFMLVVVYGVRSLERLRAFSVLLIVVSSFVTAMAVYQGQQPPQCILPPTEEEAAVLSIGTPDGRSCESPVDCREQGQWGVEWMCERIGAFNTISTGQRVRWRGQLNDPNELAVFIGGVIPLVIALATMKKSALKILLAGAFIALGVYAVILTQSRGGVLVVGVVFAIYFASRYGFKGLIAGGVLFLPLLLLGGRSGEDADASAHGRTQVLYDGVTMFMQSFVFGIGVDKFVEEESYTAHNAYLLAATELGLPGFFCWLGLLWTSVKIPFMIVRRPPARLSPELKSMALALLASFAGMAIGIFFLSFTFKQLLFVWLGLPGALYAIVRTAHPEFRVTIGRRDYFGIITLQSIILGGLFVYTRMKVGAG